jgi:hypothetical protein
MLYVNCWTVCYNYTEEEFWCAQCCPEHFAIGPRVKMWLLSHAWLMGHIFFMFSYIMSCKYVCQLVWLTYCLKVIDNLMQDFWVSSYKQTDQSWRSIFRLLPTATYSDTLSILLPNFLQLQSWICVGTYYNRVIFCVSFMQTHSDVW